MTEKIEEYVRKRFPTRFKDLALTITEFDSFVRVEAKDRSPVYLNKLTVNNL